MFPWRRTTRYPDITYMDSETDIISASKRLNSSLISRGLIDSKERIKFEESSDARRIINFVYDIIHRREKDAESKERLIDTIHENKSTEARLKRLLSQLESKCDSLERNISTISAQKDALKTSLRSLEAENKVMKDDIARQKAMLQQIRAQDATERRKRDQQFLRMKEKAGFEIRRAKPVSTIGGKLPQNSAGWILESQNSKSFFSNNAESVVLFQDRASNVIPEVIKELTDENARLIALIRETALTLSIFTGEKSVEDDEFDTVLKYLPTSFRELSIEMSNSLEALRELLHEPKYVSIDQLEQRDLEITKLRKQLEIMTRNWKDAIQTMDEWNQYIEGKGETIKLPESSKACAIVDDAAVTDQLTNLDMTESNKTETLSLADIKANLGTGLNFVDANNKGTSRLPHESRIPIKANRAAAEQRKTFDVITNKSKTAYQPERNKQNNELPILPKTPQRQTYSTTSGYDSQVRSAVKENDINRDGVSEEDQDDDPLTPTVHEIMRSAGVTPVSRRNTTSSAKPSQKLIVPGSSNSSEAHASPSREVLRGSPISKLSPAPFNFRSFLTPNICEIPNLKRRRDDTPIDDDYEAFSPIKLPKKFKSTK
ncbi:Afadin and alpha-actinin-binding-domain-containing protein [Dipodascopsis uninucleata]